MAKSNTLKHGLLNAIFNATPYSVAADAYISLHTGDPSTTGANEVTGGSYVRKQVAFNAASGGQVVNTSTVQWTGMPSATVTHIGVWDAVAGNFLWGGALTESQIIQAGEACTITAEHIIATFD